MTAEDLKGYINTKAKVEQLGRVIPKLRAEIERMEREAPMVSDVVSHGSKGGKPIKTTTITGFPDAAYQEKKTRLLTAHLELESLQADLKGKKLEVEAFAASIPSAEVTWIVELKYLCDRERTWQEVADEMTKRKLGTYTRSSVRKIFKRYMDKTKKK